MKKSVILFILTGICSALYGQAENPNLLKNPSFEEGGKFWKRAKLLPGGGLQNGNCAVYEQKNEKGRVFPIEQSITLEPDTQYEYGAYIRTEGKIAYTKKPGFIILVSFTDPDSGKYVTSRGFYTELNVPEWEMYCQTMKTPANKKYNCSFRFYLEAGSTGKVFVDEVFIRKLKDSGMRDASDPENVVENPKK